VQMWNRRDKHSSREFSYPPEIARTSVRCGVDGASPRASFAPHPATARCQPVGFAVRQL